MVIGDKTTMASDSLDLGLRFIVEPSGTTLSIEERQQLAELQPAGVMFRKRNFLKDAPYKEWLEAYRNLLGEIRSAVRRSSFIISIDHEGGNVVRFPPPVTRFPYPAIYASSDTAVERVAAMMAVELRSLGINLSFAPVADIHSNPKNPVINERAFGRSASEVAHAAGLFAKNLRAGGVIPCAKHFPGHGDTESDSHTTLPCVQRSKPELLERELKPFQALIHDQIEMIMSAHIMVPSLDPSRPATLSPAVMRTLLREEMGFQGITIADALGMKAIHASLSSGSFAEVADAAGIDLFLMVGDSVSISDAIAIRDEWRRSITTSARPGKDLLATQNRLENFMNSLPTYPVTELPHDVWAAHQRVAVELSQNAPWSAFVFDPSGFV